MKQLKSAIIFMIIVIATGVGGYMLIEGWSPLDALYMTIISITTTGFAEVRPMSAAGRVFTIGLIVLGVSAIAYIGGRAAQILIESQLFWRRRVSKKVNGLRGHYIVCGYGRLGKPICEELTAANKPFVVIEKNPAKIELLMTANYLFVNGDATQDEILLKAGISQAKGLVAVLANDADNVYLTLSAKGLNPEVFVVSKAIEEGTITKLRRAGANRIVSPNEIGASRMVHLLLRPGVADFMDVVARKRGVDLGLEEIIVHEASPLLDKTLAESALRQKLNIIIVAISRNNGQLIYNPKSSERILKNDRLIAIGQIDDLNELNSLCATGHHSG